MEDNKNTSTITTASSEKKTSGKAVALLKEFTGRKVMLIMFDGRTVVGNLLGFDQTVNLVVDKAIERVFVLNEAPREVSLGLFCVRGDNVACVGLLDDEKDAASNWQNIKVSGNVLDALRCAGFLTHCLLLHRHQH